MGQDISYRPTGSSVASLTVGEENPVPVQLRDSIGTELAPAQEGDAITGQALEAGGSHLLGWLSSIRKAITDRLGTLGQATMAGSTPVVIASDQSVVASSVADGANAAVGATSDAAVSSDATGTLSGKLRGVVKILADVWDSTNHRLACALNLSSGPAGSLLGSVSMPGDADADTQAHLSWQGIGSLRYYVRQLVYNGSTWDRWRNNLAGTVLASAARGSTTNGSDLTSYNGKRLALIVNVSDASAGGSITPSLQVKDSISGSYFTVWTASVAITTATTVAYLFGPGESGGSWTEKLAFGVPGRTFRFVFTANNANNLTYSASYELMS
jgi:hypothetical protein